MICRSKERRAIGSILKASLIRHHLLDGLDEVVIKDQPVRIMREATLEEWVADTVASSGYIPEEVRWIDPSEWFFYELETD